ncbi:MAG TPA: ATP-grasp domain-containing protein, partial [Gemmatimonadales bacterium]|nr:ATP-grasp domain-containing protein [Gemmatimonadales bacterium]
MRTLRIGFLFRRPYAPGSTSIFPKVMRALADAGVVVDVIAGKGRVIDLSTVRVEHDLYVLKQISGISLSLAGALHAQGAAIVNPYPVTVALHDKVIAARVLETAGVPIPATYVVSHPELLAPLLDPGPLVLKPYDGTGGYGVRIVRDEAELLAWPADKQPILAQR